MDNHHSCPLCHVESKIRVPYYSHGYVLHIINDKDLYLEDRRGNTKKYCPNEIAILDLRLDRFKKITKKQAFNWAKSQGLDNTLIETL